MRSPFRMQQSKRPVHHHNGNSGKRKIEPKDHRPMKMLSEHATETRASDTGKGPDSGKIALVFATVARRNNVSDNCQCERDQSSTSQPLDGARPDQRKQAGGQGASDRP